MFGAAADMLSFLLAATLAVTLMFLLTIGLMTASAASRLRGRRMEQLVQLVIRLTVMSLLAGAAELLVPDGNLRGSASTAVGLGVCFCGGDGDRAHI